MANRPLKITIILLLSLLNIVMRAYPLEKITLQLKWKHQFQFAGYYAAIEKGYYQDAGLDVTLQEYGNNIDIIDEVVLGRAQYGIFPASILIARAKGNPVVVLASIFQHSPNVLIVPAESDIYSPHDLFGKKIMNIHDDYEINAMLKHEGIDTNDYIRVRMSTNRFFELVSGHIDALAAYITAEPYTLQKLGFSYRFILPITYGIDFYGDCIFSSEKELRQHPQRVQAFLEASFKGWKYALEHQEEIVDLIIKKYHSSRTKDELLAEARETYELMLPEYIEIGHMNPGRWEHIAQTLQELGFIPPDFHLESSMFYETHHKISPALIRRIIISVSLVCFVLLTIIVVLYLFNRRLNQEVERRIQELVTKEYIFKGIFDNYTQLTGLLTPEGILTQVNNAALAMIGKKEEDVLGRYFWDTPWWTHSPDLQKKVQNAIKKAATGDNLDFEATHLDAAGTMRAIAFSIKPIKDNKGRVISLLPEGRDITQLKEIQQGLQHAQKMEAIGTLAGGIAHDFNNILSAILGYLDLALLNVEKNSETEELLQHVLSAAERAKELVAQILGFSHKRIDSGKYQKISLAETVKEALKLLRATIPSTIEFKLNINSRASILADATQIHQIMFNLCTNAYHAMEHGVGILNIELIDFVQPEEEVSELGLLPGKYALLSVSDTGTGIPPEFIDKIFDPYFTTKEIGKGTGLGLSLVHGIVQSLNGKISVKSEPGKGTHFNLYFPIYHGKDEFDTEVTPMSNLGGTEKILLVDDEESITDLTSQYLRKFGYQVSSFTDSVAALQEFKANHTQYDLILSDVTMPRMTGVELARECRLVSPTVAIILASGYNAGMDVNHLEELSVSGFLKKPIPLQSLLKTIRDILDKQL